MGYDPWWHRLKLWVGGLGFMLFLWSIRMTQEEYWHDVVEMEEEREQSEEWHRKYGEIGERGLHL